MRIVKASALALALSVSLGLGSAMAGDVSWGHGHSYAHAQKKNFVCDFFLAVLSLGHHHHGKKAVSVAY